jgi:hypothetical protein
MKVSVKCKFAVVGGPNDGYVLKYEGESDHEDWAERMDKINFKGHTYAIVEFNKDTNEGVIMW